MDVDFTEEELAELEGKTIEDESSIPDDEYGSLELSSEDGEEVSESEPQTATEAAEIEKWKKANAGLLNELIRTRNRGKEDREWREQIQERLDAISQKFPVEEAPEEDPEPDKEEDPLDWIAWQQRQGIRQELAPLKEKEAAKEVEQQREEAQKKFLADVAEQALQAEEQYIASSGMQRKDFETKLDELRFHRLSGYVNLGYSPTDAMEIVESEEMSLVLSALNEGINPAEEIVRLHEYFKVKPLPTKSPGVDDAEKLDVVQAARKGKSAEGIGNISSSGKKNVVTFEHFSSLEPDDPLFQKIYNDERLYATINIAGKVQV